MQGYLHPAFGAEIGVGAPADIGEQAGGAADAAQIGAVVQKERRDPAFDPVAMATEARLRLPFRFGRDQQGIILPNVGGQVFVEQPFAQAIGRHEKAARP